ncbi:class II fructose-bisphosphate aldolase [bacterium]|nr:class II fructose-bisphosphate aldolase [bacterium]
MSLVNLSELLKDAEERRYAVGGFVLVNLEWVKAVAEAAKRKLSPLSLCVAQVHFDFVDMEALAPAIHQAAKELPVPVAVHLDHGKSIDAIMRAIKCGFTSVMFDGSDLPFEENVEMTKRIVDFAHSVGVSVEAELGAVGGGYGKAEGGEAPPPELLTDPLQAAEFVRRTNCDALAVAIGTVHGKYKGKPKLDFERLKKIKELTNVPLVLHGGSGIPPEDVKRAIELGVRKINIYYDMQRLATERIRALVNRDGDSVTYPDIMSACKEGVREAVEYYMDIFGSTGKCSTPSHLCRNCQACTHARDASALPSFTDEELAKRIAKIVADVLKGGSS